MKRKVMAGWLATAVLGVALGVQQSTAQMMGNLFQMVGGTDTITKLASSVLQSSAGDPRLAGLLGKADVGALSPKLADQMCSMVGGGCKAPLSDDQIKEGEKKVDASQSKALGENFTSSLKGITDNPLVAQGLTKAIAPKLGGIVGALAP